MVCAVGKFCVETTPGVGKCVDQCPAGQVAAGKNCAVAQPAQPPAKSCTPVTTAPVTLSPGNTGDEFDASLQVCSNLSPPPTYSFHWQPIAGATQYHIVAKWYGNGSVTVVDQTLNASDVPNGISAAYAHLPQGRGEIYEYGWQIQATNSCTNGWGPFSSTRYYECNYQ
jgi:hypothetical protein